MRDFDVINDLQKAYGNPKATIEVLNAALKNNIVVPESALKASFDSMSTTIDGATSGILYSGRFANRAAYEAADEIVTKSDEVIAIIDKTDAFELLDDDAFQTAYEASAPEKFTALFDIAPRTGANSLWDDISHK
jgi:hypothetical protein